MKIAAALVFILMSIGPAAAGSISIWRCNNTEFRLEAQGDERSFLYEKLSANDAARYGIVSGATFWQGRRVGAKLVGTAFLYKAGCKPASYQLDGSALLNTSGEIELHGAPPEWVDSSCTTRPSLSSAAETLVFKLVSPARVVDDPE